VDAEENMPRPQNIAASQVMALADLLTHRRSRGKAQK
jgi:hypothetical protein